MADLSNWDLHGPVRTLHSEWAEWNAARREWQPPRMQTVAEFRSDGQLAERQHHNRDGSIARQILVYDEGGRLAEDQWWMNDVLDMRNLHRYDDLGRLRSVVTVNAEGGERQLEACRYDERGQKTKVAYLSVAEIKAEQCAPASCSINYAVEGTESAIGAPGATTNTITYDDKGYPVEAAFRDANDSLVRRIVFSRDGEGRLVSEVLQFGGAAPFVDERPLPPEQRDEMVQTMAAVFENDAMFSALHVYDARGRRIETVRRMGRLSEERLSVRYDDHDNPVEQVRVAIGRNVRLDDGVLKSEDEPERTEHVRFEYHYDALGNWTERVVWQRSASDPDSQRSNTERRVITYYGLLDSKLPSSLRRI
jgi:hypothetical protein